MKKKLILSLTALACVLSAGQAQVRGYCGVTDPMPLLERVTENQKTLANAPVEMRSPVTKYVPLTFILVADDNGNGRVAEEKALEQLAKLNYYYAPQDLTYYIDQWKYVNSSVIYNTPSNPTAIFQMKVHKDNNAISLFVCLTADTDGESPGITLGYYSPQNDWIVMRKDELSAFNNTLSHEAGHFFSLPHPHSGWECDPYDPDVHGNPVSSVWSPCNGSLRVELQNGTNCTIAGDRICDTTPDYNFGFGWSVGGDGCAEYTQIVMDPNGDVVTVTENNQMAYFIGCDEYMFTPNQQSLIQTDFFSSHRSYLRTGHVPTLEPVQNNVVYNYPINGENTPTFDNIDLDWEDVDGATDYLVIVARNAAFTIAPQRYMVQESFLTIEQLNANANYFWRVWPFNESQTGAGWGATQMFHTGLSSAVETIPSVNRISVYPNPTESADGLTLLMESTEAFDATISLYDLTGEAVHYQSQVHVGAYEMRIPIDTRNLQPGLYFLKVQSAEGGIITRKISIQ